MSSFNENRTLLNSTKEPEDLTTLDTVDDPAWKPTNMRLIDILYVPLVILAMIFILFGNSLVIGAVAKFKVF